jgi:histidine triad (HIT) family protein
MDTQIYKGDDIYCDLIIPRKIEIKIVTETANVLAYYDTKPHWPVHIVTTPKIHIASLLKLNDSNMSIAKELLSVVQEVAADVTSEHGVCQVLTNVGDYQDSKHLHNHVSSGEPIQ